MNEDQKMSASDIEEIQSMMDWNIAEVRRLNDNLRIHGRGGIVLITCGIAGLDPSTIRKILGAVANFEAFNADNDPDGVHDCAILTVAGIEVLWKIDAYDRSRRFRSPDPTDRKVTVRVLTVMRTDEY